MTSDERLLARAYWRLELKSRQIPLTEVDKLMCPELDTVRAKAETQKIRRRTGKYFKAYEWSAAAK